jgi:hypothetical protein
MNLHGIASGAISAVNPMIPATVASSTGYTTNPDGSRVPAYSTTPDVPIQVQALTAKEIERLNNLGIQGVLRVVYLSGNANGIVRKYGEGGDLLIFNGQTWLATTVLESWPDWTKLAVTLQMD